MLQSQSYSSIMGKISRAMIVAGLKMGRVVESLYRACFRSRLEVGSLMLGEVGGRGIRILKSAAASRTSDSGSLISPVGRLI